MMPVRVHHNDRFVTVSVVPRTDDRPINVLVSTERPEGRGVRVLENLGLSMSRVNATVIRDALNRALAETAPAPSKTDRIRRVLAEAPDGAVRARVLAILEDDEDDVPAPQEKEVLARELLELPERLYQSVMPITEAFADAVRDVLAEAERAGVVGDQ